MTKQSTPKGQEGKKCSRKYGVPMGCSQWENYGKKYKYWDYFKDQIRKETAEELLDLLMENNKGSWARIINQFK